MATPNSTAGLAGYVKGLREAKAAFQALPQIVRDNLGHATETTVREIARGAQARLQASPSIVTRNLYNHVGWSYTKTNGRGRVGIGSGSTTVSNIAAKRTFKVKGVVMSRGGRTFVDRPSRRAHFIEFGTKNMPAEPFMIPAAQAEKQPYLDRCRVSGKGIETDTAAIGMRNA